MINGLQYTNVIEMSVCLTLINTVFTVVCNRSAFASLGMVWGILLTCTRPSIPYAADSCVFLDQKRPLWSLVTCRNIDNEILRQGDVRWQSVVPVGGYIESTVLTLPGWQFNVLWPGQTGPLSFLNIIDMLPNTYRCSHA